MRDRREHTLTSTSGEVRPTRVVFFDTESFQEQTPEGETRHFLRLGVGVSTRSRRGETLRPQSEIVFRSPSEFWEWVDRCCPARSKLYIVAHNLNFDLPILHAFTSLADMGWKLESFYNKGMISLYRWRKGKRTILAVDNGNLFAGKLEKWGRVVGTEKVSVDFETVSESELLHRCKVDVEIMRRLWLMWLRFLDEIEGGSWKPTVASTAFNVWRKRFMPCDLWVHCDPLALTLEREAYHGGRVECLWSGRRDDGPFHYLDVNSMYGFVMATSKYPAGLVGSDTHVSPLRLERKMSKYSVIARVAVEVDDNYFPQRNGDHLCYPLGLQVCTLTTHELQIALSRGWLREVYAAAWYRSEYLFADYSEYFYSLRQRYTAPEQQGFNKIAKLLVNGLYGKFGQRGTHQEIIGECDPAILKRETVYDASTLDRYTLTYLGGFIYREWSEGESYHSLPGVAAHVTAEARIYLKSLMSRVPAGHLFYVDTDSLIVDDVGLEALRSFIDPNTLGALKIELSSPWLEVHSPKDYAMEGRFRSKGIKEQAIPQPDGGYLQQQWPSFAGSVRRGEVEQVVVRPVVKHLKREIASGVLLPSGWVEPFHWEAGEQEV